MSSTAGLGGVGQFSRARSEGSCLGKPATKPEFPRRVWKYRICLVCPFCPRKCFGNLGTHDKSGVVQLVALQTLDLAILVRVQAPEPPSSSLFHNVYWIIVPLASVAPEGLVSVLVSLGCPIWANLSRRSTAAF